jgi:hypothetical protein
VSYLVVEYNDIYHVSYAGIGCYNGLHCSLDNSTIDHNTIYNNTYYGIQIDGCWNMGAVCGSFTNNTITNNVANSNTVANTIGGSVGYTSISGNYVANNSFGVNATIDVSPSGYTDGGGNTCASSNYPGTVACH